MIKCPCEQCICLAICKGRLVTVHQSKKTGTFTSILRCEILDDYLKEVVPYQYRIRVDKTRRVYNLKPLFRGRYKA